LPFAAGHFLCGAVNCAHMLSNFSRYILGNGKIIERGPPAPPAAAR